MENCQNWKYDTIMNSLHKVVCCDECKNKENCFNELTSKYRIVERFGSFYVQKKIIEENISSNFFKDILCFFFEVDIRRKKYYYKWNSLDKYGNKNNYVPNLFKTIDEAELWIKSLSPKYHYLDKK